MKTILIILVILAIFLSSCASNRLVTSGIQSIRFGSGGGFTGEIIGYELSNDGSLSTFQNGDTTLVKTIKPQTTQEIWESAKAMKEIELNEPSNMYQFIEIDYQESSDRWVWGIEYKELPSELKNLYQKLTALIKDSL